MVFHITCIIDYVVDSFVYIYISKYEKQNSNHQTRVTFNFKYNSKNMQTTRQRKKKYLSFTNL